MQYQAALKVLAYTAPSARHAMTLVLEVNEDLSGVEHQVKVTTPAQALFFESFETDRIICTQLQIQN